MVGVPREDIHPEDRQISIQPGAVFRVRSGSGYRWVQSGDPETGLADVDMLVRERDAALEQLVDTQSRSNAYLLLYRAVLANSIDGFLLGEVLLDDAGEPADVKVLTVNKAFHQHTGVPAELIQGRTIKQAGLEIDPEWLSIWKRISQGGSVLRTIQAAERWLEVEVFPLEARTFGAHLRDVTDRQRAEEQRAPALEQFRLIAEFSSDMAYQIDPEARIQWISHSCGRILGFTPEEAIGRSAFDFVHPEDLQTARTALADGLDCIVRVVHESGSFRWMRFVAQTLENPIDGELITIGSAQDVDAERKLMAEVERGRTRMTATIANLMDPVVLLSAVPGPDGIEDFVYSEVNEAAAEDIGMAADDLVGRRMLDLFPSLRDTYFPMYRATATTGEPLSLDDAVLDLEARDQVGGQQRADIRVTKYEEGVVLTWRDATPRYRAAQSLHRAEELARLTLQSAPFGSASLSAEGRIESVNPALCDLLGREEDWLLGRNLGDVLGPGGSASMAHAVARLRSEGTATIEQDMITSYGTLVPARITVASVSPSGQERLLVCHFIAMPSSQRTDVPEPERR